MTINEKLNKLRNIKGYNAERLFAELLYLQKLNTEFNLNIENELDNELNLLIKKQFINDKDLKHTEDALKFASKNAKKLEVIMVSHAHLDMNWMWRYDETVATVLATFRTMLNLMEDYPKFTFSQSQASVYKIVENYSPEMLKEIKTRIHEGRWELTASQWVETDKNMPNGENLSRHILYTKKYLSELFDIKPESLQIDFEPDTFGHNANVPKILKQGDVKFLYHCRGYDKHHIYNWKSNDGSTVLAYREPDWYNAEITFNDFEYMPKFAKNNNINRLLKVYGVGDHGGGPTRRDIEKILDMQTWPLFPTIKFGTYKEFFDYLYTKKQQFPIINQELNSFSTGCYTTQTSIKKYNKYCENMLYDAEAFATFADNKNLYKYNTNLFEKSWRYVLFNTFHDILPGSCVRESKEFAMGNYQRSLAISTTQKSLALTNIANEINTKGLINEDLCKDSISEGAGVGYNHKNMCFTLAERNNGLERIYHLFNSTNYERIEPIELTIWDYPRDINNIKILNDKNEALQFQILDTNKQFYWTHNFQKILVYAKIPALGYTTIVIKYDNTKIADYPFATFPRLDIIENYTLENDLIKVEFDTNELTINSVYDKENKKYLLNNKTAIFRLIFEDTTKEMTAWIIGRYKRIENLHKNVTVKECDYIKGKLSDKITYKIDFYNSKMWITASLDKNSKRINFACKCDFREVGIPQKQVPQLNFELKLDKKIKNYTSDIACGTINRESKNLDMPSLNGVMIENGDGFISLISKSKYGFRVNNNSITLTLVRNSYEPDPLPDFGMTDFDFAIAFNENKNDFYKEIYTYKHPICVVPKAKTKTDGNLLSTDKFIDIKTDAQISCIKKPQNGNGIIIRFFEINGTSCPISITTKKNIENAYILDTNENIVEKIKQINRNHLKYNLQKFSLRALKIEFTEEK